MSKLQEQIVEYLDYGTNIKQLSPTTTTRRRWMFNLFARSIPAQSLSQLTNEMVDDFIANSGWTGATVNEFIVELKTFVRVFLRRGEKIRKFSMERLARVKETPKRKVYFTREQINHVLENCDLETWLFIRLSFDCGFRIHELQQLRLSDICGQKITFIGKGRKIRETYMAEDTRARLDEWIRQETVTDELWTHHYENGNNKPVSKRWIDQKMREAFNAAGFTEFHPHSLRHSFATEICQNGAPIEVAKEMLGHANIQTTIRYVHSLEGHLEELFHKYRFCQN